MSGHDAPPPLNDEDVKEFDDYLRDEYGIEVQTAEGSDDEQQPSFHRQVKTELNDFVSQGSPSKPESADILGNFHDSSKISNGRKDEEDEEVLIESRPQNGIKKSGYSALNDENEEKPALRSRTKEIKKESGVPSDASTRSPTSLLRSLKAHKKADEKILVTSVELSNLQMAIKYVVTDTKRHKKAWIIGFVTVFIVVWFTSLLQNAIDKSPIVFLKLSEDQVGEYDIVMTPSGISSSSFWLNFTYIDDNLREKADLTSGSAPRWVMLGRAFKSADKRNLNTSTAILWIDSHKEKEIGLGRGWNFPTLTENQTHISKTVLDGIGVSANEGETILLRFDFPGLLSASGALGSEDLQTYVKEQIEKRLGLSLSDDTFPNSKTTIEQLLQVIQSLVPFPIEPIIERILNGREMPPPQTTLDELFGMFAKSVVELLVIERNVTVVAAINEPKGKFPAALGNVAILESKFLRSLVKNSITNFQTQVSQMVDLTILETYIKTLPFEYRMAAELALAQLKTNNETLTKFARDFKENEYSLTIITMVRDRFKTYIKNKDDMNFDMIRVTNQIADAIGYLYPVSFTLPLQTALVPLYYVRLSLDQVFTFVVVVLIVLGALLIYSLLLSNVEEKTYEYGMLRALGMKNYVLIELLLTQSLSFFIPGILLGLALSFFVFLPIGFYISKFSLAPVDVTMGTWALVSGISLGLVMPLVALIGPVKRALSKTLRDALDIYHQVQSETTVQIIRLEKLGLSPWQVTVSLMMVIMGFVVYYVIPFAFTFANFPLFFFILTMILLGMLFGLSLIGTTLQPWAEKISVYILLWGSDYRSLSSMVRKNLAAHGRRNMKTAIMFTTSLAFIIFAGSSFSLQAHTLADTVSLASGADITIFAPRAPLNEFPIRDYLDQEMRKENSLVVGYSFTTFQLSKHYWVGKTVISNLAGYPVIPIGVFGVDENYLNETYARFFRYSEYDTTNNFKYTETSNGKKDVLRSLYEDAGKAALPIESGGIKVPDPIISIDVPTDTEYYEKALSEAYKNYIDVLVSESLRTTASIDTKTPLKLSVGGRSYLAKTRALIESCPGFGFSSYSQTAINSPVILSMPSFYRLLQDAWHPRKTPMQATPNKQTLRVRMAPKVTADNREYIVNGLRNFIKDSTTQIIDTQSVLDTTKVAVTLLNLFFYVVSVIAVSLCFLVLWLSFTANVNENAWEFGVLRAIGLDSFAVIRMYVYEALCLILSSVFIGAAIGLLVSITLTMQFNLFTQMPFTFDFPYGLFGAVLVMSVSVAIVGSYLPALTIKKKDIAIALKNL